MEEILASIRRIISEDEDDTATTAAETAPSDATEPEIEAATDESEDTELALENETPSEPESAPEQTLIETEDLEMIKKNVAEAIEHDTDDAILDESTAAAASEAFQNLSQSIRVSAGDGQTLEDLVIVMLRPMSRELTRKRDTLDAWRLLSVRKRDRARRDGVSVDPRWRTVPIMRASGSMPRPRRMTS